MRRDKIYNVVELFSGIGSQAKALRNIGAEINVQKTCEWNFHAFLAYSLIHDMQGKPENVKFNKKELVEILSEIGLSGDGKAPITKSGLQAYNEYALRKIYATVESTRNLVDISRVKGEEIGRHIDIMTYSFPCQDLSNVGSFHGYNKGIDRDAGNRSGMLWEVERILLERMEQDMHMPRFLLMENVPTLNSDRHIGNFMEWQNQLNKMGYYNEQFQLNARNFGLPQNRERLLMISVYTDGDPDVEAEAKEFFRVHGPRLKDYSEKLHPEKKKLRDFLRTDYSIKKYYDEALECQPNATPSRLKIWEQNPQLTDERGNIKDIITATITTKQDRHPNSGNLKLNFNNGKSEWRYLTPRECFMLMGFSEEDYEKVTANNFTVKKGCKMFTRDNLIRMAGNSIAVNVLEAVFSLIMDLDERLFI